MYQGIVLWFWKYISIHVSYLEEGPIVRSNAILQISMVPWPSIKVNSHIEHLAVKESFKHHSFLDHDW